MIRAPLLSGAPDANAGSALACATLVGPACQNDRRRRDDARARQGEQAFSGDVEVPHRRFVKPVAAGIGLDDTRSDMMVWLRYL
jgi:hypothetical protein